MKKKTNKGVYPAKILCGKGKKVQCSSSYKKFKKEEEEDEEDGWIISSKLCAIDVLSIVHCTTEAHQTCIKTKV